MPLDRIIKEAYFKDMGTIVIDHSLHPYRKRHLTTHSLTHHLFHRDKKANFLDDKGDEFNYWTLGPLWSS